MQVDSKPEELDELDRRIIQLKIEREALNKEDDVASRGRLEKLETELADLEEKANALTQRWSREKEKLSSAQKIKEELEASYGRIPELEKQLGEAEADDGDSGAMLEEAVTADHIAQVVSRWTGIPVDKMLEGEKDKLLACRIRTGQSAHSCSSAPPAWARPSWQKRWPASCSTMSRRWSASTCRNIWRSIPLPV
jgi:ATP-dependent Clp protease ATP-binding subunit ClpB